MVIHPVNPMSTFRFTYKNDIPSDVVYMYKVYYCTDNIPVIEDFVSIYTLVEYRDIPMYVYAKDNYIQIDVNFSEMERPVLTSEQKKRMKEVENTGEVIRADKFGEGVKFEHDYKDEANEDFLFLKNEWLC